MKKSLLFVFAMAFAFSGASIASAEEGSLDVTVDGSTTQIKTDGRIRPIGSSTRPIIRENIQEKRAELKEKASSTRSAIELKRDALKAEIDAKKMELKDKKGEIKEDIKERRAELGERKDEIKENVSERLAKFKQNTFERLSKQLSNFNSIKSRIESRIAKIEETGTSTTQVKADLVIAGTKLATASTSINAILSVEISSTTPKTSAEALKTAVNKAQVALRDAHQTLMKIVGDVGKLNKSSRPEKKERPATSTPSSTNN